MEDREKFIGYLRHLGYELYVDKKSKEVVVHDINKGNYYKADEEQLKSLCETVDKFIEFQIEDQLKVMKFYEWIE